MRSPSVDRKAVFLNAPYDEEFKELYLAYIAGLCQLGYQPRIAAGIPGGERRLNRIFKLIKTCSYSIHDLSRVELSAALPATPRFNMPLELGLSIAWALIHPKLHTWSIWESSPRRLQKSMSDLDGTDPYIHYGHAKGVLSELRNFVSDRHPSLLLPSVAQMLEAYQILASCVDQILEDAGTSNLYAASVFRQLCFVAICATGSTSTR